MDKEEALCGFAIYNTPVGDIKIEYSGDEITGICYINKKESIGDACSCDLTDKAFSQLMEYFEGQRKTFDLPLSMKGTEFQKKVWHELLNIPYGETRSYKQIAESIGNPKAVRAVGMANNRNPIAIVVPCHRVVGSNGKLVGYAGGLDVKQLLLNIESLHSHNNTLI